MGVWKALGPFCRQTGLQNIHVHKCAQGAGVTNNRGEAEHMHTHRQTHVHTRSKSTSRACSAQQSSLWVTLACQTCFLQTADIVPEKILPLVLVCVRRERGKGWETCLIDGESLYSSRTPEAVTMCKSRTCSCPFTLIFYVWVWVSYRGRETAIFVNISSRAKKQRGRRRWELREISEQPTDRTKKPLTASISLCICQCLPISSSLLSSISHQIFQLTWWSSELLRMCILPPILLVNLDGGGGGG